MLDLHRPRSAWVEAGVSAAATSSTPHDPSWVMSVPLVVLAGLSVVGGLINLPFTRQLGPPRPLARPSRRREHVPSALHTAQQWYFAS